MSNRTIVVGVDGSDCAREALQLAAEEAKLRDAPLRIVCAWEVPLPIYMRGAPGAPPVDPSIFDTYKEDARHVVDDARTTVLQSHPDVTCEVRVVEGDPARTLIEESHDAALAVVGNRGRGGFRSLLLGSVSQQVVHHSHCPVLVVRQPKGTDGAVQPDLPGRRSIQQRMRDGSLPLGSVEEQGAPRGNNGR